MYINMNTYTYAHRHTPWATPNLDPPTKALPCDGIEKAEAVEETVANTMMAVAVENCILIEFCFRDRCDCAGLVHHVGILHTVMAS